MKTEEEIAKRISEWEETKADFIKNFGNKVNSQFIAECNLAIACFKWVLQT